VSKRAKKITVDGIDYELGAEIDLDAEAVRLADGSRLTEARAAQLGEEIASRGRGRPSLTEAGKSSPHVSFRVSARIRRRAEHRAKAEGKTVSQVAREALERHLEAGPEPSQ
jgi:hypothetical protein